MRKKHLISLVIPVRNESSKVDATMAAIFASSRLPDEIVIADGMSTDDTVEQFMLHANKGIDICVVPNPAIFSGGGRNAGVKASRGEIIILADCGNPVARNWIEEMVRPFEEQDNVDIVCGVFEPLVESDFEHCVAAIQYTQNYMLGQYSDAQLHALMPKVVLPGGGTLAMTRSTFDTIGGYPEWLHRAQDKVFSRKAYALGMRVVVNWQARITHHMRSTPGEVLKLTFEYGRGNGRSRYVSRHFIKLAAFYTFLLMLFVGVLFSPWYLVAAMATLAGYTYRSGLHKIMRKDGGLKHLRFLWMAPAVLWSRDMGILIGHATGWMEWLLIPRFRSLFYQYMEGGEPSRLPVFEP